MIRVGTNVKFLAKCAVWPIMDARNGSLSRNSSCVSLSNQSCFFLRWDFAFILRLHIFSSIPESYYSIFSVPNLFWYETSFNLSNFDYSTRDRYFTLFLVLCKLLKRITIFRLTIHFFNLHGFHFSTQDCDSSCLYVRALQAVGLGFASTVVSNVAVILLWNPLHISYWSQFEDNEFVLLLSY